MRAEAPILFYTSNLRTFRTTLVGYLYQLCRHRQVVLLTEDLDDETSRLLADHMLFPGLLARVSVGQFSATRETLRARSRRLFRLARQIVKSWKPGIVFIPGVNLFERYLRRYAKESCGAVCIDEIGLLTVRELDELKLLLNLHSANVRFPPWIPHPARLFLAQSRRWLAQFVHDIPIPILAGTRPFIGMNGVFRWDYTRLDGMDFAIVFTRETQILLLRGGADPDKLLVIPHPMKPGAADAIWQAYGIGARIGKTEEIRKYIVTCFLDIESKWGFKRDDLSLIPDEVLYDSRARVIRALVSALPDWEIRIKPHPMSADSPIFDIVRKKIEDISHRIVWVSPAESAERHIAASGAVVGFPPASTVVYSAAMLCPGIPAAVVDVNQELRGDAFRNMHGIVTIGTWSELDARLADLREGKWAERPYQHDTGDFETLDDLVTNIRDSALMSSSRPLV